MEMVFEVLVEDQSGQKLLEHVFRKYGLERYKRRFETHYRSYKGIGGFPKGKDALNVKSQHLLADLPKRMRAIQEAYRYIDTQFCIVVIIDNDKRDTDEFYSLLETLAERVGITSDRFFAIAVEEMEAWLLGDINAMIEAYPDYKDRILSKHSQYIQDSICGTWEKLADMLTMNGMSGFRNLYPTPGDVGRCKCKWADDIGKYMNLRENCSQSFKRFLRELDKRCSLDE